MFVLPSMLIKLPPQSESELYATVLSIFLSVRLSPVCRLQAAAAYRIGHSGPTGLFSSHQLTL